ncbi:heat-inducible transcriptional repressor HrcA [Geomesophilobacter sediminis]|uniref:Heat-inducible transcription repressor HrcA n=1 Tax=Geomesophilobacter sediminis TaxID=2798584 RepID=A0A8J7LYW8_9BACT|nr:heat-inducible transcriptional repressor HrcA [Geomesophilobacter sediminis]MBJ6725617.1 heat-inducible transcription repressor HrcA [Geomesophilobacter sediminis]
MDEQLTARSKQILQAVIEDYIATAEPVGSRTITRSHPISLSPATVRNVMADLEEMGFLVSPHTSAGRVPTDKAYRFYVNSILSAGNLQQGNQEEILKRCNFTGKDVDDVLKETSRLLSATSSYMGVVMAPRFAAHVYRQIEFVKLGSHRILAILVSQSGAVQNRLIQTEQEILQEDLVRMSNYLNELLHGLTIAQVRERLLQEMQSEKARYDSLFARALKLSEEVLGDDDREVFLDGQANILDQPEFADTAKMREIFRAFEQKNLLLDLLDRSLEAEGVQIFIGADSPLLRMEGMSLIASTYMTGKDTVGVLGVIGPTRMGYGKVIPIVDYTAKLISRLLEVE